MENITEFYNINFRHIKENVSENNILYKHCHMEYELIYILQGNAHFVIENKKFVIRENNLLIIKPGEYHYLKLINNSKYERIVLSFPSKAVPEEIFNEFNNHIKTVQICYIEGIRNLLINYEQSMQYKNPAPLLYSYFVQLIYAIVFQDKKVEPEQILLDDLSQKIINYIEENLLNIITLDDISARLFVSKSSLCHTFKESMKISIMQYIRQKKVIYAKKLLLYGKRATEVSLLCGFKDYSMFYKTYKKIMNEIPSKSKEK